MPPPPPVGRRLAAAAVWFAAGWGAMQGEIGIKFTLSNDLGYIKGAQREGEVRPPAGLAQTHPPAPAVVTAQHSVAAAP